MAKNLSIKKRARQSKKRAIVNSQVRSKTKTAIKKLAFEIKNNNLEGLPNLIKTVYSTLDKALKKGVYHKNYVARRKSILTKKVNNIANTENSSV